MGLCTCFGTCDCILQGAGQVSISGSGDVADPYIITGQETPFDLTSLSQALVVTPGGPDGHLPEIDLLLDPASSAPVSVSPTGLRIDCCSVGAEVGMTEVAAGTPTQVDIPSTGNTSALSWQRSITNNEATPMLVHVSGQPRADTEINLGIDVVLEAAARLTITSAHTWVGGGTQRSLRINYYQDGTDATPGRDMIWIDDLAGWAVIPAGETLVVESNMAVSFKQNLLSDAGSGRGYTFQTPMILAVPIRPTPLDVVGA